MKKKLLALILSVLMLVSVIPMAASAADSNFLYDAVFDDDAYYHLAYVKDEDFFEDDITWATVLGGYDAWANYFSKDKDITYAEAILMMLIDKVDAVYENELAEEIIDVLEKAQSVAEVAEKIDEYTGILGIAENSEWAEAMGIVGDVIAVANYGNAVYEKYVEGYAAIISAKAASVYYGNLLDYLAANCANEAVQDAAANIKVKIDSELEDAVKDLAEELAAASGEDAAVMGVKIALDSYSVTAAIKTGYGYVSSFSEAIFNLSAKAEYMTSLVEIYDIEQCIKTWVDDAIDDTDDDFEGFAVSSFITIRQAGEDFLLALANKTNTSYIELIKDYDTTEMEIRSALASAKLSAIRDVIANNASAQIDSAIVITGKSDVLLQNVATGEVVYTIADGAALKEVTDDGIFFSYDNTYLGEFVKVAFMVAPNDYDVYICNADSGCSYVEFDSAASGAFDTYNVCVGLKSSRAVAVLNTANWAVAGELPKFKVEDPGAEIAEGVMTTAFDVNINAIAGVETEPGSGNSNAGTSGGVSSGTTNKKLSFGEMIKEFFENLFASFKNIFSIFG